MGFDIPPAAAPRVRAQQMGEPVNDPHRSGPADRRCQRREVTCGEADNGREIGRGPVAVDEGIRKADVTADHNAAKHAPALDDDHGVRPRFPARPFHNRARRQHDGQPSVGDLAE